jgi:hypothetical protein
MDLVEVDVVGAEALETLRHGIHDVAAARADIVRALAHAAVALGGEDDV